MTKLTDEQVNKRLHELLGLCWHDKVGSKYDFRIDFTTSWEAFGLLWTWLQEHDRWEAFCEWYDIDGHPSLYTIDLISPLALSKAVVEFFGGIKDAK